MQILAHNKRIKIIKKTFVVQQVNKYLEEIKSPFSLHTLTTYILNYLREAAKLQKTKFFPSGQALILRLPLYKNHDTVLQWACFC